MTGMTRTNIQIRLMIQHWTVAREPEISGDQNCFADLIEVAWYDTWHSVWYIIILYDHYIHGCLFYMLNESTDVCYPLYSILNYTSRWRDGHYIVYSRYIARQTQGVKSINCGSKRTASFQTLVIYCCGTMRRWTLYVWSHISYQKSMNRYVVIRRFSKCRQFEQKLRGHPRLFTGQIVGSQQE